MQKHLKRAPTPLFDRCVRCSANRRSVARLQYIAIYSSLTKEHPWAEHFTSLPKRGVGDIKWLNSSLKRSLSKAVAWTQGSSRTLLTNGSIPYIPNALIHSFTTTLSFRCATAKWAIYNQTARLAHTSRELTLNNGLSYQEHSLGEIVWVIRLGPLCLSVYRPCGQQGLPKICCLITGVSVTHGSVILTSSCL